MSAKDAKSGKARNSGKVGNSGKSSAASSKAKGLKVEEMMRARARQRALIVGAVVLILVAVAVAVALILTRKAEEPASPPKGSGTTGTDAVGPAGALDSGGILVGQDLAPGGAAPAADEAVTVEIISDFVCPWCGTLEQVHGEALAAKAAAGEIRLVVHPVVNSVLADLNDHYSKRAMLAVETVAVLEPDKFWAFYEELWANQPEESQTSGDLTDAAIADLAAGVGVSQATIDQFTDSPVAEWAEWSSGEGAKRAKGTPVAYLSFDGSEPQVWNGWLLSGTNEDGEQVYAPGDLDKAIANVKDGKAPDDE
jgi:protein-disulfide isomerase